jgi:hypothetical protein
VRLTGLSARLLAVRRVGLLAGRRAGLRWDVFEVGVHDERYLDRSSSIS